MKRSMRISAFVLAALMAVTVTACAKPAAPAATTAAPAAPAATTAAPAAPAAPAATQAAAPAATEAPKEEFKATPTYTLRFGHTLTEEDPFHQAYLSWADEVYKQTKGDLKIEVYANSQLGVEEDVLEQIRQGANIGWQTDFARGGSYVKELGVMNCPYFLGSIDEMKALVDSPTMAGWFDKLAKDYNLRAFSFAYIQGFRNVYTNKPVHNPSEFAGLRIRTANAPAWLESVNSLGCVATALNYGEIYTGIQTKVVDGCELPYTAAFNLKIQEVAKYIIETHHIYQAQLYVVNEDWWNSLPAEYQKIMTDVMNEKGYEVSELLEKNDLSYRDRMVSEFGMTLIKNEELDMDAFRAGSQAAYDKLGLADAKAAIYKELGKS